VDSKGTLIADHTGECFSEAVFAGLALGGAAVGFDLLALNSDGRATVTASSATVL
jgi:hypothetical protein